MSKSIICADWILNPIIPSEHAPLPEHLDNGFKEAFRHWFGMSFKPLMYCGSQLVAGKNHMFICLGTEIAPDETEIKTIAKVILFETLPDENNHTTFSVSSINSLAEDRGLDGGWHIDPQKIEIPSEIKDIFGSLKISGAHYNPLLLCASQVVSGINYLLICEASIVAATEVKLLASVILNRPASGEDCRIISVENILGPVFNNKTEDAVEAPTFIPASGQASIYHSLTQEDWEIFEKAMKGFVGVGYRPLAVSSQVINGLMRIYLCEATMMNVGFSRHLANVYVAQLFNGDIKLENITRLVEIHKD